jgi:hypothetical protein
MPDEPAPPPGLDYDALAAAIIRQREAAAPAPPAPTHAEAQARLLGDISRGSVPSSLGALLLRKIHEMPAADAVESVAGLPAMIARHGPEAVSALLGGAPPPAPEPPPAPVEPPPPPPAPGSLAYSVQSHAQHHEGGWGLARGSQPYQTSDTLRELARRAELTPQERWEELNRGRAPHLFAQPAQQPTRRVPRQKQPQPGKHHKAWALGAWARHTGKHRSNDPIVTLTNA